MRPENSNGFILLEVLVAMSLILGVWMASIGAYKGLALRLIEQEAKRFQFREAFDAYEITEYLRANSEQIQPSISSKDLKREPSRVSSRNRSLRPVVKPTSAN
jgi:3-methyladenine DNA glycosylase Tag